MKLAFIWPIKRSRCTSMQQMCGAALAVTSLPLEAAVPHVASTVLMYVFRLTLRFADTQPSQSCGHADQLDVSAMRMSFSSFQLCKSWRGFALLITQSIQRRGASLISTSYTSLCGRKRRWRRRRQHRRFLSDYGAPWRGSSVHMFDVYDGRGWFRLGF